MKKVFLSLLVATSSIFSMDTVDVFLKDYNPVVNGTLYVGDIIDYNNKNIVVGTGECSKDGTYTATFRTINTTTKYGGTEVRKINLPEPYKTDCAKFATAANDANNYEIIIPDELPLKNGTKAKFGTTEYFGSKNCANIPTYIASNGRKEVSLVVFRACFTPSVMYPEKEVPEVASVVKWDGASSSKLNYLKDLKATIKAWDAIVKAEFNTLWEDRGETRNRYTLADVAKYGKDLPRLGDFVTSDGYYLFSVLPNPEKGGLTLAFGSTRLVYDVDVKPEVKNALDTILHDETSKVTGVYACHPSIDNPNVEFGMIDVMYGNKVVMSLLAPTLDKDGFPVCDKSMLGKTHNVKEFIGMNRLAIYASKPAIVK